MRKLAIFTALLLCAGCAPESEHVGLVCSGRVIVKDAFWVNSPYKDIGYDIRYKSPSDSYMYVPNPGEICRIVVASAIPDNMVPLIGESRAR